MTDATIWLSKYEESNDEDGGSVHVAEVFRSKNTVSTPISLLSPSLRLMVSYSEVLQHLVLFQNSSGKDHIVAISYL
jgi:hypothetical protein